MSASGCRRQIRSGARQRELERAPAFLRGAFIRRESPTERRYTLSFRLLVLDILTFKPASHHLVV